MVIANAPQTTTDIQNGLASAALKNSKPFYGEPVFIMVMGCKTCCQVTNHTMRRPRAESLEGCVSFIKLIEAECEGKSPPLNIPGLGKKGMPEPTALPNARQRAADAINNSRPRPSRRENQPDTPPTQREIQAFLHRLRKTSFRPEVEGEFHRLDEGARS